MDIYSKTLRAQGERLVSKLKAANIGSRPIVWIGHSMGGEYKF